MLNTLAPRFLVLADWMTVELDARMASWHAPALARIAGTWLGQSHIGPPSVTPRFEGFADAFLYLGPTTSLTTSRPDSAMYADTAYLRELLRRDAIQGGANAAELKRLSERYLGDKDCVRQPNALAWSGAIQVHHGARGKGGRTRRVGRTVRRRAIALRQVRCILMQDSSRRGLLMAAPPVLFATTFAAFQIFTRAFGLTIGYLCGFLFYWLFWCAAVPAIVLGWRGSAALFRGAPRGLAVQPGSARWPWRFLSSWLRLAFPRALIGATPNAILVSAVIAAVNAPLEELLWRGTYVAVFPQTTVLSYVYPTICFGLWHFAPLSVVPNRAPGGSPSFVLASCVVGFLWGGSRCVHARFV
jgi:hypothetical protein